MKKNNHHETIQFSQYENIVELLSLINRQLNNLSDIEIQSQIDLQEITELKHDVELKLNEVNDIFENFHDDRNRSVESYKLKIKKGKKSIEKVTERMKDIFLRVDEKMKKYKYYEPNNEKRKRNENNNNFLYEKENRERETEKRKRKIQIQKQNEFLNRVKKNENLINQRSNKIEKIERDVLDVVELTKQLQYLAKEQEYGLTSIDDHIENGLDQMKRGNRELTDAEKLQKNMRCIIS